MATTGVDPTMPDHCENCIEYRPVPWASGYGFCRRVADVLVFWKKSECLSPPIKESVEGR